MITLIVGRCGSGKSYYAVEQLRKLKEKNFIAFDYAGDYGEFTELTNYEETLDKLRRVEFPIRYFSGVTEYDENFFYVILKRVKGIILVIDEFNLYTSRGKEKSHLNTLLRLHRHNRIHFVGITQRPSDISKTVLSQANKIIAFNTVENGDLKLLGKLGFDIEELKKLPKYSYLTKQY